LDKPKLTDLELQGEYLKILINTINSIETGV